MMHKLRAVMGKRDDMYTLCNSIEIDEGFFESTSGNIQEAEGQKPEDQDPKKEKEGGGAVNNPRFWLWWNQRKWGKSVRNINIGQIRK